MHGSSAGHGSKSPVGKWEAPSCGRNGKTAVVWWGNFFPRMVEPQTDKWLLRKQTSNQISWNEIRHKKKKNTIESQFLCMRQFRSDFVELVVLDLNKYINQYVTSTVRYQDTYDIKIRTTQADCYSFSAFPLCISPPKKQGVGSPSYPPCSFPSPISLHDERERWWHLLGDGDWVPNQTSYEAVSLLLICCPHRCSDSFVFPSTRRAHIRRRRAQMALTFRHLSLLSLHEDTLMQSKCFLQ